MIVVDTTVLSALMVEPSAANPSRTALVTKLWDSDTHWFAPDLWRHELVSVVWKYIQAGMLTVTQADEILFETHSFMADRTSRVSHIAVLNCALEYGISTYDAHFIALAKGLSVPLFTHDTKLIKRCPDVARHPEDQD